jgi:hypothetical protein
LLKEEPDRRIQISIRAGLGGERMVDIAKGFGAVHQVIKRLELKKASDVALARRFAKPEVAVKSVKS